MAYNSRTRDPLLEAKMQATIRKRFSELLGLLLVALGVLAILSLWSYSPNDPSPTNPSSKAPENMMGALGANFSGLFYFVLGLAVWAIPLALIIWGSRLVLHRMDGKVWPRIIFLPIFFVFLAVFMDNVPPPENWSNGFGLGGVSGGAVMDAIKDNQVFDLRNFIKPVVLLLGVISAALGIFTLGFTWGDVKRSLIRGFYLIIVGLETLWRLFVRLLKFGGGSIRRSASSISAAREARKHASEEPLEDDMPQIETEERLPKQAKAPKAAGRKTLFPTLPVFGKGSDRGEAVPKTDPDFDAPLDLVNTDNTLIDQKDRVSRRIKEAIERKKLTQPPTEEDASFNQVEQDEERPSELAPTIENLVEPQNDTPINIFSDEPSELDLGIQRRAEPQLSSTKSVVEHPPIRKIPQSAKAKEEAQPNLFKSKKTAFETPALNLLANPTTIVRHQLSDEALEQNARMLENVLDDYGVKGEIVSVRPGPVVTMYELEPAPGLKASRVIGLADDIARSMSALAARVSTVPGKTVIGIELPNDNRETVLLREILSSRDFGDGKHSLPLALGKDISGKPEVSDLAKMPHLLIAGTTGSGKSVAINTMIMSLLYKLSPDECRMIMIDPKMLELSVYDGIPHLLSPVVTDPKKAVVALKWVVGEMEERYRKMSKMGVRNISGYNGRVEDALAKGENFERTVQTGFDETTGEPIFETETMTPEKMPFIVVIVDEMADLMMVAGKEIEACIQRLAQMARASGIHLIMATQRPSVDVITGTIKANFPTRISFQVTSKIDSRTILGEMGAEQLLGMGDMLFMAGGGKVTRIHAPFISDEEVEVIVNHLKTYGPPEYVSGVVKAADDEKSSNIDAVLGLGGNTDKENALYDTAVQIVAQDRKCSTSYIQRKLSIGYNKAAKLVEEMEANGVVSSANHVGKREILLPEQP